MIADRDNCEVAIVGGGPAGVSCGYVLAKAGMDVVILERGKFPGAKNMFGGVFFSSQMNDLMPGFYDEAPIERFVAQRRYSMLVDGSEINIGFAPREYKKPPHNHSFIVKRSKFDRWFATKAEEAGAKIVNDVTVRDVLWDGDRVVGVASGPGDDNALLADVVVCAEGANSLLAEKTGLRNRLSMRSRAIAVKEVIKLPRNVIDERFGLTGKEGAAYEYFGDAVCGMLGDGFIYTCGDSLSVGVGVLISELYTRNDSLSPNELLDRFKSHPCILPLIKGGETVEYSAHMIPSDGYKNIPRLYTDGLVLVGDSAGLLNNSLFHEGVNMAMASGMKAAETILRNRKSKDYDAEALSHYERLLKNSFVLEDMENCREFLDIMHMHREITRDYPHVIKDTLVKIFEVNGSSKRILRREALKDIRKRVSLRKTAKALEAMIRCGM